MSEDALITGAAAPEGHRWIRSTAVLDAGWVLVAALAVIVSSFFALIDLPNAGLRTGDEPLRFFVLGLPMIAIVICIVGMLRSSVVVVAAATGIVAPSVAFAGSLGASLLLSDASAFADVGVAISIGAALIGVVMLVRWFVYHPMPLLGNQARPIPLAGYAVTGLGVAIAVIQIVTSFVGDTGLETATIGQTSFLLTVACVVIAAGVTRTIAAAWLACSACAAQVVAVVVVRLEQSTIPLDSDLVLRTGLAGMVALLVTAVVSAIAALNVAPDPEPELDPDAVEYWRWNPDD